MWNLCRLAETLVPLIDNDENRAIELVNDEVKAFESEFKSVWLNFMRHKIGLNNPENGDFELIQGLLNAMQEGEADFTLTFRRLSQAVRGESASIRHLFNKPTLYDLWEQDWRFRLGRETTSSEERARKMDKVNPVYIPRNHKVEEALSMAVDDGDLSAFKTILSTVSAPFVEILGREGYAEPAPKNTIPYRTFCGT